MRPVLSRTSSAIRVSGRRRFPCRDDWRLRGRSTYLRIGTDWHKCWRFAYEGTTRPVDARPGSGGAEEG